MSEKSDIAQSRVLLYLLDHPEDIVECGLSEEYFIDESFRNIYKCIDTLSSKDVRITKDSVRQALTDCEVRDPMKTAQVFLADNNANTLEDIKDAIAELREEEHLSRVTDSIRILYEAVKESNSLNPRNVSILQDTLSNVYAELSKDTSESKVLTMNQFLEKYLEEFNKRENGKVYSFHDKLLDSMVKEGPLPGTGGIVAAASGMCKSAYALNLVHKLVQAGVPVIYFSFEMGLVTTGDRWMSIDTGVPYKEFADVLPENFTNARLKVEEVRNRYKDNPYFGICEQADMSLADIEREIVAFKKRAGVDYCMVVFDLITMILDFVKEGASLASVIELAINKVNAQSKRLNYSWIGLVQTNRASEEDKVRDLMDIEKLKPTRTSIKNSGALLERARWTVTLFRRKYYAETYLSEEEAEQLDDIIEVSLLKANNNKTGHKECLYDGETFRVEDI